MPPALIQSLPLSGPPSLLASGAVSPLVMPQPYAGSNLEPEWLPEHRSVRTLAGTDRIVQRRWRGRFRLGWRSLPRSVFEALLDVLEESSFTFTPRTALPGEATTETQPDGSVVSLLRSYEVRCASALPTTRRLVQTVYDIDVELVTTGIVGDALPDPIGGGSSETPAVSPGDTFESSSGQIVLECPDAVVFYEDGGGDDPRLSDGSTVDLDAAEEADGVARFTKTVEDHRGYGFDIRKVEVVTGSPAAASEPAGAFQWTVCPLACVLLVEGETDQKSVRDVEFEFIHDPIGSGTHTVRLTVSYDCALLDAVLTFNVTKA